MTKNPRYFADHPESLSGFSGSPDIDAFSGILSAIRLRGDAVRRCSSESPFDIAVPESDRVLHIAETPGLRVHIDGELVCALDAGDMVLLARGTAHRLSGGEPPGEDEPLGAIAWISGRFTAERAAADPLLSVLPPAIVVRAARAGHEWLPLSLQLILTEVVTPSPGSWVMISRILDLLFIHALREWSTSDRNEPGWLTAAMDPRLAPVLTAIHNDLAHPWSIAELAKHARQSRSAFTQRFTELLGQPPAGYITERRLDRAAQLLRSSTDAVSQIGRSVGYTSDAAFSRAFQRRFGEPPLRWRIHHRPS
ncbi:AraC family transcriptional regulator [Mycobacteroides saopaulense]|uniref:AraC family transcriptional regulator n=1 Tax=Mycobacteroides saopaulense TaxID=1578165 RepID=A0A1X0IKG2_9MYCO|nr:AraC family transcriptional regulator [Mycobacteroides saopaulense]ORB47941.1 AraC family transcriptional regulator [Mycobacteroides saopaulense]